MAGKYRSGGLFIILIALDQVSKYWASQSLSIFRNYDFAFSTTLPEPVMYLVYGLVLGLVSWYIWTHQKKLTGVESFAWILIVAGAVSNIGERLLNGYVKDFIYLFSGVFNFADFYILLGIVLLFVVRGKVRPTH